MFFSGRLGIPEPDGHRAGAGLHPPRHAVGAAGMPSLPGRVPDGSSGAADLDSGFANSPRASSAEMGRVLSAAETRRRHSKDCIGWLWKRGVQATVHRYLPRLPLFVWWMRACRREEVMLMPTLE